MSEIKVLDALYIGRGISSHGFRAYNVVGKDKENNQFLIAFSCKSNFTDTVEKAFSRLSPITVPEEPTTPITTQEGELVNESKQH